jgi:hypothetical protein
LPEPSGFSFFSGVRLRRGGEAIGAVAGPPNLLAPIPLVGHQTAVYAGGELLGGEVNEEEKIELDSVNWCCKNATFSDAYI